ncbi:MAG: hypothetical protein HC887_09025 [Desulfobacteraceae bacterium]|nr:hypothetical protein [Desulfobacteraceae bacterium]
MLIAGIAYFAGSYIYERNLLTEAETKLAAVEKSPPAQYDEDMHRLFSDFSAQIEKKIAPSLSS